MVLLGDGRMDRGIFHVAGMWIVYAATAAESRTPRALCKGANIFGLRCVVIDSGLREVCRDGVDKHATGSRGAGGYREGRQRFRGFLSCDWLIKAHQAHRTPVQLDFNLNTELSYSRKFFLSSINLKQCCSVFRV